MSAQLLNTIGLVLDIAGVIGLFFFGLPPKINTAGYFIGFDPVESELRKEKWFTRFSWASLGLLVAGFALQIWSNWL